MIAQCITDTQSAQLAFDFGMKKKIVGEFTGEKSSVNGGVVLLREADDKMRLTERIAELVPDKRDQLRIEIKYKSLIRQALYQKSAGYEDNNDSEITRDDPAFMVSAGSENPVTGRELASTSTLHRFEYSATKEELKALQGLIPDLFLDTRAKLPRKIELDCDTTCDPVHGDQEGAMYNGFYEERCYEPMCIWERRTGFPLAAELRGGGPGPAEGARRVLERVVNKIHARHADILIDYSADAAFALPDLLAYCEQERNKITYYIGIKSNHALMQKEEVKRALEQARNEFVALHGEPQMLKGKEQRKKEERIRCSSKEEGRQQELAEQAERCVRVYGDCLYQAREWPGERRVVLRVEYTDNGPDIRFVVTNNKTAPSPKWIYEEKYCKRCRCENCVKEMKALKMDRLSCQEFLPNQFRLLLATFGYALLVYIREMLPDDSSHLSVTSIQKRLLKMAVTVRETARKIHFHWSRWYPFQADFMYVLLRLRAT